MVSSISIKIPPRQLNAKRFHSNVNSWSIHSTSDWFLPLRSKHFLNFRSCFHRNRYPPPSQGSSHGACVCLRARKPYGACGSPRGSAPRKTVPASGGDVRRRWREKAARSLIATPSAGGIRAHRGDGALQLRVVQKGPWPVPRSPRARCF